MMIVRWLTSKTVRRARAMYRHVAKLLKAQEDILSPQAIAAIQEAIAKLRQAVEQGTDKAGLIAEMESLEKTAEKWLKPYPFAAWRENVEVFLVALAVAMGIRTFFLQPFKIPTGSMEPTLLGITSENWINQPDKKIPGPVGRFFGYWINGVSYTHVVARSEGSLGNFDREPKHFLLFNLSQRFQIGGETYTVWFPPDKLLERAGLAGQDENGNWLVNRKVFKAGEDVIRLKSTAGDHLFVNRLTYNFRHPERGEIIVFKTAGIHDPRVPTDEYYIKRLVALSGEEVQIGADQHLIINGRRLDSSTPHFANIYSFKPDAGPDQYFGHTRIGNFADPDAKYTVPDGDIMVMGDNTRNSLDSRFFGGFPEKYVIGKSSFVYWPISERFGFGYK